MQTTQKIYSQTGQYLATQCLTCGKYVEINTQASNEPPPTPRCSCQGCAR